MTTSQTVFEGSYLIALPVSHPLANQEQISLVSLIDEPIIFYGEISRWANSLARRKGTGISGGFNFIIESQKLGSHNLP